MKLSQRNLDGIASLNRDQCVRLLHLANATRGLRPADGPLFDQFSAACEAHIADIDQFRANRRAYAVAVSAAKELLGISV